MDYHLGVDPSTVSTGYALLDDNGKLVRYGVIKPPEDLSNEAKLRYQYEILETLLQVYHVCTVTCEEQFNGPNVDTLKKIARTSSMIMLLAAQKDTTLYMMYPAQWRKLAHGNGGVKKEDTRILVNDKYDLALKKKDNDISDAIGICLAGYMKHKEAKEAS